MRKRRSKKRTRVAARRAGAPTVGELAYLLKELQQIADSHPALYYQVHQLIGWLLLPDNLIWRQTANKNIMRHAAVRQLLEEGRRWDTGGAGGAFQGASNDLADHPAAAGPHAMEKAYKQIERTLPPAARRPRKH